MKEYSLAGCGGVGGPTGANFLLKTPKLSILVDCGLAQGSKYAEKENYDSFKYDPKTINYRELGDALIESGNIREFNILGMTCLAYNYLENLFEYLEEKFPRQN